MVASKCWRHGRNRPMMRIEMVILPVFGDGVGVRFPGFDVKQVEDVRASDFVATMEEEAHEILSEMSDKELRAPCLI